MHKTQIQLLLMLITFGLLFFIYIIQTKHSLRTGISIEEPLSAPAPSERFSSTDKVRLTLNPVSSYNHLSKEELYALRTQFVQDSIFSYPEYKPSEAVFGQIVSYAPWYGLNYSGCIGQTRGTEKVIEGPSEESRFVNNPILLVGVLIGSQRVTPGAAACFDKRYWMLPQAASYDPVSNTLEVIYDFRYPYNITLTGINARDLGYSYVYAENPQNYHFINPQNISNQVHKFQDFIHLGGTCQYKNGCNNGSPYQPELVLKAAAFPISINLKLWKKRPLSAQNKADINFKITIR